MRYLLILSVFLVSCGTNKHFFELSHDKDALHNESLSRKEASGEYKDFSKNLLNQCYRDKNFDVKSYARTKLDYLKTSFSYWSSIGSCYIHKNENQKGLFFYKLAFPHIKTKSQRAIYYNNLGVFYSKVNRKDSAIEFFEKSIDEDKSYKTPHMNLAMIYAQFNLNRSAKKHIGYINNKSDPHIKYIEAVIDFNEGKKDALKEVVKLLPEYLTEEQKKLAYETFEKSKAKK